MKVSVVIPCYNVAEFISRALDSVIHQTYSDTEIILVDDGSTDGTNEIIAKYKKKFPKKIQFQRQAKSGASSARNKGTRAATGIYIQFLDADDELLPAKIETQVKLAEQNNNPGLIAGAYRKESSGKEWSVDVSVEDPVEALIAGKLGCTCSNLFLKSSLEECGGWPEDLGSSQEAELMFRMLKKNCRVVFDKRTNTIVHGRTSGSISSAEPAKNIERYLALRGAIAEWLEENRSMTEKRKQALMLNIAGALLRLYSHDKILAMKYYNSLFQGRYSIRSGPGVSGMYAFLVRNFGFNLAARLSKMAGRS
ncbi:MAG: glycosyltransferase family 2 protein [Bacteroidetes bacterium]|nr:glycosyltransferase family 2 protein [Bacteroidota bacterium]